MREEENGILNNIKSVYGNLTTLEKEIADFFLNGPDIKDFSAQNVAAHLFISTPSQSLIRLPDKICPEMRIFWIQAVFV